MIGGITERAGRTVAALGLAALVVAAPLAAHAADGAAKPPVAGEADSERSGTLAEAPRLIDSADAEAIAAIGLGFGEAQVDATQDGEPVIYGELNGIAYQLFFLNCEGAADCDVLNFYAIWDVKGVGLDAINTWNRERPFYKAYLTGELLPVIELNLPVAGGVTRAQIEQAYEAFTVGVAAFETEIVDGAAL